jgi:hypothetical protein
VLGGLGVAWLVLGFVVQGLAYVLTINRGGRTSGSALVAAALGLGTVIISVALAYALQPPLVKWEGRRAACIALVKVTDKFFAARRDPLPYGDRLELIGRFLGYPDRHENESQEEYAKRVWGLSVIQPGSYPDQ